MHGLTPSICLANEKRISFLWYFLLPLALLALAPSSQSLWIDESYIARFVALPNNLQEWCILAWRDPLAEPFKPGYALTAYFFSYIFGVTEYGLRCANLVWGATALVALGLVGKKIRISWLPLAFAAHPFVWFYMNEARPYAMQLAASSWMLTALVFLTVPDGMRRSRVIWTNVFWVASLACYSANMLGSLSIASCLIAAAGIFIRKRRWPEREVWMWSAPWILLHAFLSVYFVYRMATYPSSVGAICWPLTPANIGFALYELLGFLAFGPGRDEIREVAQSTGVRGVLSLMVPCAIFLGGFAAFNIVALIGGIKSWLAGTHRLFIFLFSAAAALNILFMFIGAYFAGWPFWGRHLTPVFPFLLCLCAIGYAGFGNLTKTLASIWVGMMLAASIHMRFGEMHPKDDYRSAAAYARTVIAQQKTVWWAADDISANYYNLFPVNKEAAAQHHYAPPFAYSRWPQPPPAGSTPGEALLVVSPLPEQLAVLPYPYTIILSKVDINDMNGVLRDWMRNNRFRLVKSFAAFSVWQAD